MMMMMMIRRRAPVVLNHEPVQVRHREKLGISTREIDSRNPQARSPSFTTRLHICHYHHWKGGRSTVLVPCTYLKICFWFTPQKWCFWKWNRRNDQIISFFLADNHNTSIDALIFDNCYYFISSLWKLSRFIWKNNAKISSKYQDKNELSTLVFRWKKIRSNNQDLYLGVDRRPWGEWAGWVSRVSKALKTKRFYTKLW